MSSKGRRSECEVREKPSRENMYAAGARLNEQQPAPKKSTLFEYIPYTFPPASIFTTPICAFVSWAASIAAFCVAENSAASTSARIDDRR